jgi:hypothetical protein
MEKEKKITLPNDIYQLGVSMFEILAAIPAVDIDTKESFREGYQEIPSNLKELMISCVRGDSTKRPDINGVIEILQEVIIPSMSPEYKLAVAQIAQKIQGISERHSDGAHKFRTLTNRDVDELFSTLRTSYDLMRNRGFKTPVPEIESIIGETMERDLQHIAEFIIRYHKDYRHLPIPKNMSDAWIFYSDSIARWEQNRKVDIGWEDDNYLIEPKNPVHRGR